MNINTVKDIIEDGLCCFELVSSFALTAFVDKIMPMDSLHAIPSSMKEKAITSDADSSRKKAPAPRA